MTRTQYYTAMSVDGFIADPDNSLDWLFQAESSPGKDDRFAGFFAGVGAMAMGATTYEWVLEHEHLTGNPGKWRQWYGSTPCWVFTHRQLPVIPGADLVFARGDVLAVHEEMTTAADGRNIWLVGGGNLVGQFADQGLVDEILLGIAPAILGGGAPLLPRRLLSSSVTLAAVEQDGQFVFLTYHLDADPGDPRWEAFVAAMLAAGQAYERRSRYGGKPAVFIEGREVAHLEAPGVIDLRITRQGWSQARDDYGDDPAVRHDPSRRDWIELHLQSPADLGRLTQLLDIAMAANA